MRQITLSSIQFPSGHTVDESIANARSLLDEAGRRGSDIVCLPEAYPDRAMATHSEARPDGPSIAVAAAKARQYRMYVISPTVEARDGRKFNAAVLIDRQGEIIGTYDKTHLTPGEVAKGLTEGRELPVFDLDFGRIGIMTCYDNSFPEVFSVFRARDAQIVFWPTMAYGFSEFDQVAQKCAACFDNGFYFVSSNYYSPMPYEPSKSFCRTYVISPEGLVVADSGYHAGVLTTYIDLEQRWTAKDYSYGQPQSWTQLLEPFRRDDIYAKTLTHPEQFLDADGERAPRTVRAAAVALPETDAPEPTQALDYLETSLAGSPGLDLIVLPENFLYGGAAEEHSSTLSPLDSPQLDLIGRLARAHGAWLVAPVYEREGDRIFATALLLDRAGEIRGRYRKTHLSRVERDWHGVSPGDDLPVFETELGRIGILLGRDYYYPEAYAVLAVKGADVVCWSSSPYPYYPNAVQMQSLLLSRPLYHLANLVAATFCVGPPYKVGKLIRSAAIVDHYGQVLATSAARPGIASASLRLPPVRYGFSGWNAPVAGRSPGVARRVAERASLYAPAWSSPAGETSGEGQVVTPLVGVDGPALLSRPDG